MKQFRPYLIAVAAGAGLVWVVPVVLSALAAVPGLGSLLRAMKAAGIPLQLYSMLVTYLPIFALSFLVGAALRRYVSGTGRGHLLVCGATWLICAAVFLIYVYAGTDVNWSGEIPTVALVPLGLLSAAFVRPAPSLDKSLDQSASGGGTLSH